jgi:DNA helicase-2/ATP-dependent DNA helicase PcrA
LASYPSRNSPTDSTDEAEHLARLGIPYADPDVVERMLEEQVNRRVLEACRLLVNPLDSIAWAALLFLTDGIGDAFFDYIYELAQEGRCRFGHALRTAYESDFPDVRAVSAKKARGLIKTILSWLEAHASPNERPENGWGHWIIETVGDDVVPAPTGHFSELLQDLDELSEPDQDFGRYLGQIGPLGRDLALAQSDGIRIMSMMSAKGLTVRATIIPAVEEGLIPRPDADLGEERRLLYVGMTRSKGFLYCTWARRRSGPTARAGAPQIRTMRRHSTFLQGGPVESQDGRAYIRSRWH